MSRITRANIERVSFNNYAVGIDEIAIAGIHVTVIGQPVPLLCMRLQEGKSCDD
jgi:hypothetical protein